MNDAIDEAVQIILGLSSDDLVTFARRLAAQNSPRADVLADLLIDAVFTSTIIAEAQRGRGRLAQ